MTATPISDDLKEGMIENMDDPEECTYCDGIIGRVNGLKACKACHTTPAGNFIDENSDESYEDEIDQWPYERSQKEDDRETYQSYSLKFGGYPVILNGGFEAAYRDPENGLEYCIEQDVYDENPHHEDIIIWH